MFKYLVLPISLCVGLVACAQEPTPQVSPSTQVSISIKVFPSTQASPSPTPTVTELSRRAAEIEMGMTLKQIVKLLDRMPDTVITKAFLKEAGEPETVFPGLITYVWRNGRNCRPVRVGFDKEGGELVATHLYEGRDCDGTFTGVFGKPCKGNPLCKI